VQERDQIVDLVGLKDRAVGGHALAAMLDLVLDLRLAEPLADRREIGAAVGADAVDAVAVLAALRPRIAEASTAGTAARPAGSAAETTSAASADTMRIASMASPRRPEMRTARACTLAGEDCMGMTPE
jgi:hypothetical protein